MRPSGAGKARPPGTRVPAAYLVCLLGGICALILGAAFLDSALAKRARRRAPALESWFDTSAYRDQRSVERAIAETITRYTSERGLDPDPSKVPGAASGADSGRREAATRHRQRKREVEKEQRAGNEAFQRRIVKAKQAHAGNLAREKRLAMRIISLREEHEGLKARIGSKRAEAGRQEDVRRSLADTVKQAERDFHVVYTNLHSAYVVAGVIRCTGKNMLREVGRADGVLRQGIDAEVSRIGHAGFTHMVKTLKLGGSSARYGSLITVDRSLSILPLGEPIKTTMEILGKRGQRSKVVAHAGVKLFPVALFPRISDPSAAAPGSPPKRPKAPPRCLLEAFVLHGPAGRVDPPCSASGNRRSGKVEPWVTELCRRPEFSRIFSETDKRAGRKVTEYGRLRELVDGWNDENRDASRWEEDVHAYVRDMEAVAARRKDHGRQHKEAKSAVEDLVEEARAQRNKVRKACADLDKARSENAEMGAELRRSLMSHSVILMPLPAVQAADRDLEQAAGLLADSLLRNARKEAVMRHKTLRQQYFSSSGEQATVALVDRHSETAAPLPKGFRILTVAPTNVPGGQDGYWVEMAFKFEITLDPELMVGSSEHPSRVPGVPGLWRAPRAGKLVYFETGRSMPHRRAKAKMADLNRQKVGGSAAWRLPTAADEDTVRTLCATALSAAGSRPPAACSCAWTSRRGRSDFIPGHVEAYQVIREARSREPAVLQSTASCGTVLIAQAGERRSDPCRGYRGE